MTPAARSILFFSFYLLPLGVVLVVAPNVLLGLFGIAATSEVWIRVVGVLVFLLGVYYNTAARHDLVPFFRATVWARFAVLASFVAFVLLGLVSPVLILFGLVDAAGAAWTWAGLRQSSRP
jgi:hypothetical protein